MRPGDRRGGGSRDWRQGGPVRSEPRDISLDESGAVDTSRCMRLLVHAADRKRGSRADGPVDRRVDDKAMRGIGEIRGPSDLSRRTSRPTKAGSWMRRAARGCSCHAGDERGLPRGRSGRPTGRCPRRCSRLAKPTCGGRSRPTDLSPPGSMAAGPSCTELSRVLERTRAAPRLRRDADAAIDPEPGGCEPTLAWAARREVRP